MWWSEYHVDRWYIDHFLRDRLVEEALHLSVTDDINCAYADEDGTLWFAGLNKVWHWDGKQLRLLPSAKPVPGYDTQALVRGRDGALWRSVVRGGFPVRAG